MACCNPTIQLCEPGGALVTAVLDLDAGTTAYFNQDGTAFAGDPTTLSECGDTSSLADGLNQFTHSDGAGVDVTVPQAALVVDSVYQGTITDSEGVSDSFISRLDDCTGTAIDAAAASIVTVEQLIADGKGYYIPFDDSGDGCTPNPRTGCIDEAAVTFNPGGAIYTAAAGQAAFARQTLGDRPMTRAALNVGTPGFYLGNLGDNATLIPETFITLSNNTCELLCFHIQVGSHFDMSHGVNDIVNGVTQTMHVDLTIDGGATWLLDYIHTGINNRRHDFWQFRSGGTCVLPNATKDIGVRGRYTSTGAVDAASGVNNPGIFVTILGGFDV